MNRERALGGTEAATRRTSTSTRARPRRQSIICRKSLETKGIPASRPELRHRPAAGCK